MPVVAFAGVILAAVPAIGATGAFIASSVIIGSAVGGISSALAGGNIGKGMLLGAATGLVSGGIGAAAGGATNVGANAAANTATATTEASSIATGGIGTTGNIPAGAMITPGAANAAGGGLLQPIAPSLGNIAPSLSGAGPGITPAATGSTTPFMMRGAANPSPVVTPPVDPTIAAQKSITQGQMISGAAQAAGSYFQGRETAAATEKAARIEADNEAKRREAEQVRYERSPGLLGARLSQEYTAPRRATFNRQTGRWEYAATN